MDLVFNADLESNLNNYNTAGQMILTDQNNIYLVQSDLSKIKFTDVLFVASLPTNGQKTNKLYITPDFKINIWDGSSWNASSNTLADSGVTAGTYKSVTVDIKGRVTDGTNPTTLSGYGITDATPSSHIGSTGTAHGVVTPSVNGFMSSTDKSKLDNISANADTVADSTTNGNILINGTETIVYTHPTSDGNLHVPSTGTTNNGNVLKAGSTAGSISWSTLTKGDVGLSNVVNVDTSSTANITDSANKRFVTDAQKTVLSNTSGTNTGNETTATMGSMINNATAKTTPVDNDMFGLMDSASSNILKKLSWSNIKATLKGYFDTFYALATHTHTKSQITDMPTKLSDFTNDENFMTSLPIATISSLGGIKVGDNLSITADGVLSGNSNPSNYIVKQEVFTATAGQTVFNLTLGTYTTGQNAIALYIYGEKFPNNLFNETSSSSITLKDGSIFQGGEQVIIEYIQLINTTPYPIHANEHLTSGTDPIPLSTTSTDGLMSASDKTILSNATNSNTASTLVKRDSSGNFSAGTITATLNGNSNTATTLATAKKINGVNFNGSTDITVYDSTKEPSIVAGTTSQYYRGDKSWQTLNKTAVGLGNVDNTSDINKPISTATQTALDVKLDSALYTASDVLVKLKTVDGSNSGIDSDTVDGKHYSDVTNYVISRGQNLVTNGTALLGDNTNFSSFTLDKSDSYGSGGSFKDSLYNSTRSNDELIPVNPDLSYRFSFYAKTNPYVGSHYYGTLLCYDVDKLQISPTHTMYIPNTLTTLAQDLKTGDTKIYLTDATNWKNSVGTATHQRSMIVWDYQNAGGYLYPPLTYSRHYYGYDLWSDGAVDYVNNCITLKTAWTDGTILAGTQVSNGSSGGTFKYCTSCSNSTIPSTWTLYTGIIGNIDTSGTNLTNKFHPATAYIKIGWLNNRDITGSTVWYSNISFGVDIPTKTSQLTNDSGYITNTELNTKTPFTTLSASTPATANWYRIATSALNIGANSGLFKIDFSGTGVKGNALLRVSCHDGVVNGTNINQLGFTTTNTALGLTQARVVYNTTATGNYAYVEIYNPTALAITYTVDLIDTTGWSLIIPNTVGSIPSGYTSETVILDIGLVSEEDVTATRQLVSKVATGTAPLSVSSTTKVANLNAELLDGIDSTGFMKSINANGYYGLARPSDGNTTDWIRTTVNGIIPYQSGSSSSLGTSSWQFANIYGVNIYDNNVLLENKYAPLSSPVLTGTPTAPTPATADNSTNIATTAFVKAQGYITSAQAGTIVTVSNTAPTSPKAGDIFIQTY